MQMPGVGRAVGEARVGERGEGGWHWLASVVVVVVRRCGRNKRNEKR